MAYDLNKLANLLHIKTLVEKIKETFATKSEFNSTKSDLQYQISSMSSYVNSQFSTLSNYVDTKLVDLNGSLSYKIDEKIASAYKARGSKTFAQLPTSFDNNVPPFAASWMGNVYNVTDAFTTTDLFVEGAGKEYPAGTNVVVVQDGSAYKLDVLAGFVDLSGYVENGKIAADAEVDELLDELFEA